MEFTARREAKYPAIVGLLDHAWAEFVPFLSFDPEIRMVIYTTNVDLRASTLGSGRR
jgi:putative transposase